MPETTPATDPGEGSIVVAGTGRIAVAPDVAELRLGVAVDRPTVEAARAEAAALMAAILDAVDGAGVAKRDVRTALLSVQPRYDYRDGKPPTLTGYELANVVEVTVRDLGRLGDVIDATLAAGATSLDGLSFRVADPSPAERDARIRAMAEARARADVLARAADLAIVGVASVVEGAVADAPRPFAKAERMMLAADAATPVEAGSQEVVVTVTVTYRTR
ncbi:MAG TPA: SIMPL domain-containing protein [Candidatus Limnocylindrales bacterium]